MAMLQLPSKFRTSEHVQIASVPKQSALSVLTSKEGARGTVSYSAKLQISSYLSDDRL